MEIIVVIAIVLAYLYYRSEKCPHGIYKGNAIPARCKSCELKRKREEAEKKRKEEEEDKEKLEAAEKLLREKRNLEEKIKSLKIQWAEESKKLTFWQNLNPESFQKLVWVLFKKLGWQVEERPFSQDGGCDGVLTKDGKRWALQCKRYRGTVGEPVIRDLFGTCNHFGVEGGILLTTGRISGPAKVFAKGKTIELIDGEKLISLANRAEILPEELPIEIDGLLPVYEVQISKLEAEKNKIISEMQKEDCPECKLGKLEIKTWDSGLVKRCSRYPNCSYSRRF